MTQRHLLTTRAIRVLILVAVCSFAGLTGCTHISNVMLPPHENSFDRKGERIIITPLDLEGMDVLLRELAETKRTSSIGKEIDGVSEDIRQLINGAQGRAVANVAIQSGVGSVQESRANDTMKTLEQETRTAYDSRYSQRVSLDPFWDIEGDKVAVRWAGFEIVRMTARSKSKPAFRMICAIVPSRDGLAFSVRPVFLEVNRTKAKILHPKPMQFWVWPYIWMLEPSNEVYIKADVRIDAMWMTQDRTTHQDIIGAFSFRVPRYNIDENEFIVLSPDALFANDEELGAARANRWNDRGFGYQGGWFPAIPAYLDESGKPVGRAMCALEVTISERDPSNAKRVTDTAVRVVENTRVSIRP